MYILFLLTKYPVLLVETNPLSHSDVSPRSDLTLTYLRVSHEYQHRAGRSMTSNLQQSVAGGHLQGSDISAPLYYVKKPWSYPSRLRGGMSKPKEVRIASDDLNKWQDHEKTHDLRNEAIRLFCRHPRPAV